MNGLCRVPVLELAIQMCVCPSQFQEERGNVLMGASVHSNYESFVYRQEVRQAYIVWGDQPTCDSLM